MLKAMFKRLRSNRGFTLVELLVVVAILGLIGSLAVPRVVGAFDDAKKEAEKADIAMVQGAVDRYFLDLELGKTGISGWPTDKGAEPSGTGTVALDYQKLANYLTKVPGTVYQINASRQVVK